MRKVSRNTPTSRSAKSSRATRNDPFRGQVAVGDFRYGEAWRSQMSCIAPSLMIPFDRSDHAIAESRQVSTAQSIAGERHSLSAARLGTQLPPPDPKFGGVIKENASQSKAWWAPRVVPPKGAPNVLLILTDDVGF